jgi:hypothetical protein
MDFNRWTSSALPFDHKTFKIESVNVKFKRKSKKRKWKRKRKKVARGIEPLKSVSFQMFHPIICLAVKVY